MRYAKRPQDREELERRPVSGTLEEDHRSPIPREVQTEAGKCHEAHS